MPRQLDIIMGTIENGLMKIVASLSFDCDWWGEVIEFIPVTPESLTWRNETAFVNLISAYAGQSLPASQQHVHNTH